MVALGHVRGPTGGIRVCRGGGRQVAAELVQVAADGLRAVVTTLYKSAGTFMTRLITVSIDGVSAAADRKLENRECASVARVALTLDNGQSVRRLLEERDLAPAPRPD